MLNLKKTFASWAKIHSLKVFVIGRWRREDEGCAQCFNYKLGYVVQVRPITVNRHKESLNSWTSCKPCRFYGQLQPFCWFKVAYLLSLGNPQCLPRFRNRVLLWVENLGQTSDVVDKIWKFQIFVNLFLIDLLALQLANNHPPLIQCEALLRHLREAATGHCHDEEKCNLIFKNSVLFNNPKYTHAIAFKG